MKLIINQAQGKFKTPFRLLRISCSFFCVLALSACLDLVEDSAAPCGGPDDCSAPRQCIMNRCVAACYSDEDCAQNEQCLRQTCVSQPDINASNIPESESTAGKHCGRKPRGRKQRAKALRVKALRAKPLREKALRVKLPQVKICG